VPDAEKDPDTFILNILGQPPTGAVMGCATLANLKWTATERPRSVTAKWHVAVVVMLAVGPINAGLGAGPPTDEHGSSAVGDSGSSWVFDTPGIATVQKLISGQTATSETGPLGGFPDAATGWDLWNQNQTACDPPACEHRTCDTPACEHRTGWFDNFSAFTGLEGVKSPEDLGINANFGLRAAANWGIPLLEQYGIGAQLGSALNYSRTAVRVLRSVTDTRDNTQGFFTAGLFQRTDFGLSWGVVYDFLLQNYYQEFEFGQWRGQIGYAVTNNDEFGLWGAIRDFSESGQVGDQAFQLRPILQGNVYWRHIWEHEIVTRIWVGVAEEHGRFVLVAPGNTSVHHPVEFGADVFVPLSDRLALFGEANFITPNDTGTVTATFGIAFYPGGKARETARSKFAPLLPLANNETFAIDLRQ
jgi:hypothetical protein